MKEVLKCPNCESNYVVFIQELEKYICKSCKHMFHPHKSRKTKRIFISYGHDKHAELAIKLKTDLEALGHFVWIDESEIKAGKDWEISIEKGIAGSHIVLALLTPHAVRRPDGICLDELSFARFHHKQIVPLMVEKCVPPLSINRIQWLDMEDWNISEEKYREKLSMILDVIEGNLPCFEGSQALLLEKLHPIDFRADQFKK